MRISIIGADSDLGRALSKRLTARHQLRIYTCFAGAGPTHASQHRADVPAATPVDLRREADADECCRDVDAVIQLEASTGAEDLQAVDAIDGWARGAYNLCLAARAAGLDRIVLASTLTIFDAYDGNYLIDEWWKPLPATDPYSLGAYSAEEVARQCCLQGGVQVVALRFLPLGSDPEQNTSPADAVLAVERALALPLEAPGYRWQVFHIARSKRFATRRAKTVLGWEEADARR